MEQNDKLQRSGLAEHFSAVKVLAEKNDAAYTHLLAEQGCEPESTWMIGNSPKSDINPALAVGMNAVFCRTTLPGYWSMKWWPRRRPAARCLSWPRLRICFSTSSESKTRGKQKSQPVRLAFVCALKFGAEEGT